MTVAARSSGIGRGIAVLAAAIVAAACAAPARADVPAQQALVVLLDAHVARVAPHAHARRLETVPEHRPLTRVRTVLPVIGHARGGWVRVILPGRPNAHKGWIRSYRTRPSSTPWQLRVDLSARRVTVYRDGVVQRRFRAVIGAPATPTPRGRFFVEEAVRLAASASGGPFALATSARSEVLQEFEGGPGQIALHGTNHLLGAPGTAVSHGCIRLTTAAITWLAERIGRGVPVTVTG
jgi:lipoprotein-anchoring transpeptidase ErfK/SrfK